MLGRELTSISAVIRDTFAIGTPGGRLDLDLPIRATAVKLWLDVLTGKPLLVLEPSHLHPFRRVLSLCRQFDCPSAISIVLATLQAAIEVKGTPAIEILKLSAEYGGHRPFVKCITARGRLPWAKTVALDADLTEDLDVLYDEGTVIRDSATWPWRDFCQLPPSYAWALLRSHRVSVNLAGQTEKLKSLLASIDSELTICLRLLNFVAPKSVHKLRRS